MKHSISVLTSASLIVILLFAISVIGFADGLHGDVNADGKVSVADAKWILQSVTGTRTLDENQQRLADVNKDGKISIVDAKWILQAVAGLRDITDKPYQKADTTELEALLKQALEFDESVYTEDTYSALKTAIAEAQKIIDAQKADESEVANATAALENAINNLKTYRQCLAETISYAKSIDLSVYTKQSRSRLNVIVNGAQRILDNENSTLQQVINAIERINNAIDLLETSQQALERIRLQLKDKIDDAKAVDKALYTEESVNNLQTAITNAQAVLDDEASTYEQIENEINNVDSAIKKLVSFKSLLQEAIEKAEYYYKNKKTDGSPDLAFYIDKAKTVLNDENSTAEDYKSTTEELKTATTEFVEYFKSIYGDDAVIDWK